MGYDGFFDRGATRRTLLALGVVGEFPGIEGRTRGRDSVGESGEGSLGHFCPSWRLRGGGGEIGILKVVTYCHGRYALLSMGVT